MICARKNTTHRFTPVYSGLQRFTAVYSGLQRFTPVYSAGSGLSHAKLRLKSSVSVQSSSPVRVQRRGNGHALRITETSQQARGSASDNGSQSMIRVINETHWSHR